MKVSFDKDVNFKELNRFVKENKIDCTLRGLNIEQKNYQVLERCALSVLSNAKLPARLGNKVSSENLEIINRIVGKQNMDDCLHLESATYNKDDYFLTEDKDILDKRTELRKEFHFLEIFSLEEFKNNCRK